MEEEAGLRTYAPAQAILGALRLTPQRLRSPTRIGIGTPLLRLLLQGFAASLPFDPEWYLATNPDLQQAHAAGEIPDLHRHFIGSGWLEGRRGAPPPVDEAWYLETYPDVREAVAAGHIPSATQHYLQTGAKEGRVPCREAEPAARLWREALRAFPPEL